MCVCVCVCVCVWWWLGERQKSQTEQKHHLTVRTGSHVHCVLGIVAEALLLCWVWRWVLSGEAFTVWSLIITGQKKKKKQKNNNNKQITSPSPKKMFYLTPVSLPDCWRWQVSKLWTWLFAWTGLAWLNLWLESLKVSPNPDQRTVFGLHTPLNSFHRSEEVCLWHYIQFPSYAHRPNSQ